MQQKKVNLIDNFFLMEKHNNLFSIKSDKSLPIWDIFRFYVFNKIFFESTENSTDKLASKSVKKTNFFLNLIQIITSYRYLFGNYYVYLFYSCSRTCNSKNQYFDIYYENIKPHLNGDCVLYETINGKKMYTNDVRIFNIFGYIELILQFIIKYIPFLYKYDTKTDIIFNIIESTFGKNKISKKELQLKLRMFEIEVSIFKFIISRSKVKKIFYYGYSKSLIQAAKQSNIPIYELQHGSIESTSLSYIYKVETKNIILPDKLLTFSEEWTKNKSIPIPCFEIGTKNIPKLTSLESVVSNSLVLLSSPYQGDLLIKLAIDIAKLKPDLVIYFKLHPMEFDKYSHYKAISFGIMNINIVEISTSFLDILTISDDFILIYSSTLYELLQSNKSIYIYESNFFINSDIGAHDSIKYFNNAQELINFYLNRNPTKSSLKIYYKPFDEIAFLNATLN